MKRALCAALLLALALAGCGVRAAQPLTAEERPADGAGARPRENERAADTVGRMLAGMSREEKVWQMLVLFPQQIVGEASTADAALWQEGMAAHPAGGVIFDGENIISETALKEMLAAAGAAGKIAPLLCVDEEGGAVARVSYALGVTTKFKPMFTYREGGTETAYANAQTIGSEIAAFGFNVDFAPVADVWTNPENTVIGRRAYSDEPEEAAALVSAAVRGFHAGGVACVLKHFPGHGDTAEDSHDTAAYCSKTLEELEACELIPFAAGMAAGADMVMVGHITLPALDPEHPATLSRDVVTGLLRERMGYDGVVITDALRMGALSGERADAAEAAVLAVEAGCDLLLAPEDPEAVVQALLTSVDEARLDESVRRILTLKLARGLIAAEGE